MNLLIDKHYVSVNFKIFSVVIIGSWLNNSRYYTTSYHALLELPYFTKTMNAIEEFQYLLEQIQLIQKNSFLGEFCWQNIHLISVLLSESQYHVQDMLKSNYLGVIWFTSLIQKMRRFPQRNTKTVSETKKKHKEASWKKFYNLAFSVFTRHQLNSQRDVRKLVPRNRIKSPSLFYIFELVTVHSNIKMELRVLSFFVQFE